MYELISGLVHKGEIPSIVVIIYPLDVPSFPNDVSAIVASRLNKCVRMLSFLVKSKKIAHRF